MAKQEKQETTVALKDLEPKTKGRKPVPENETSNQRFCRIMNRRLPDTVKRLGHIDNLFKGGQYDCTKEQAAFVIGQLSSMIEQISNHAFNVKNKDVDIAKLNPVD